jgi:hypothetical protein
MEYGNGDAAFASIFLGIWLGFIGLTFLIAIAGYVLNGFALMALFRKVGIEPWAAWVPIFNIWRLLELGGQAGWFSLFAFVPYGGSVVAVIFECLSVYRIGLAFRKSGSWVVLFIFLPFVWAWLLAADAETYDPSLLAQHGYGPPLVGFGSARGPYVPQPPYQAPPAA